LLAGSNWAAWLAIGTALRGLAQPANNTAAASAKVNRVLWLYVEII
jgi:hypothetical protein